MLEKEGSFSYASWGLIYMQLISAVGLHFTLLYISIIDDVHLVSGMLVCMLEEIVYGVTRGKLFKYPCHFVYMCTCSCVK